MILFILFLFFLLYRLGIHRLKRLEDQGKDRPKLRRALTWLKPFIDLLLAVFQCGIKTILTVLNHLITYLNRIKTQRGQFYCFCFWPFKRNP